MSQLSKNAEKRFSLNSKLIEDARRFFYSRNDLFWIIGGAGSGKTTVARKLSKKFNIQIYDMDEHIYGEYHKRFLSSLHPNAKMWSSSKDGLSWLLEMNWDEFNSFNEAVLPEYLNLLVEDIITSYAENSLIIDGGICNPVLLSQMFPVANIVCLKVAGTSSLEIWTGSSERIVMKKLISRLPNPDDNWEKFLFFDENITANILNESKNSGIQICERKKDENIEHLAQRVSDIFGI